MKKIKPAMWFRLSGGLCLLIVLFYALWFSPLRRYFTVSNAILWVESARMSPWCGLLFFVGFVVGVLAVPITLFPIVGGVLFPFWVALPINLLATVTGAWLAFSIARLFGREMVENFLRGKLKSFDERATAEGLKAVVVMRWLGIPPFTLTNYALGLSGVRFKDFFWGTLLGVLPWMVIVTYAANSLWEAVLLGGEKGLLQAMVVKLGPLMIFSACVFVYLLASAMVRRRRKAVLTL